MEREFETIHVPRTKQTFTIKSWLTGGEMIDLEAYTAGQGTRSVNGQTGEVMINAEQAYRQRLRKLADIMISKVSSPVAASETPVEVTDKPKIWDMVCDLPAVDYNVLMMKIDSILTTGGSLSEAEKKA